MSAKPGHETPSPPTPPSTASGLIAEMFGVLDSNPALYQGMLRYWLMWRFPQIIACIQGATGLKFHLCGTYQGLLDNFLRLFLLPDFLVVGQCGPVLRHELLHYEHPFGQHWPNTDGRQPRVGVFGGKPDRPIVDGVVKFSMEWIRALGPSGGTLLAPFTTMLAPPMPTRSSATVEELLRQAEADTRDGRLPGKTLSEVAQEKVQRLQPGETVPLGHPPGSPEDEAERKVFDLTKMQRAYGRFFWPSAAISQIDPLWTPSDIVAFEFLMAQRLGSMLVVAGEWCNVLPAPGHELTVKIPCLEGVSPMKLMAAIEAEEGAYAEFRRTISSALIEALDKRGSEAFSRELINIQRNIIDAGVAKLERRLKEFRKKRRARIGQYAMGTLGVSVGLYFSLTPVALAALMGGLGVSLFGEIQRHITEQANLRDEPMHFIWRLGR